MEEKSEEMIGRYLAGEMTGREAEDFNKELEENPALREQVNVYRRIWELGSSGNESSWDVDAAWDRFTSSVGPAKINKPFLSTTKVYWAAAAAVLLLLVSVLVYFNKSTPAIYASKGTTENLIELKDGSKILLNEGADITVYPFSKKERHVILHGEAYFEIAPDTKRPFTVSSGSTLTEVFGTAFNLSQSAGRTTILVSEGKVLFSSKENKEMVVALTAGEAAFFENDKIEIITNPSPNIHAWRTRQLTFVNKMTVKEIVADASAYFGKEIIIENEAMEDCKISISRPFKNPEIKPVLEAIALAINARLIIEGEKFILRGGICS